jgi:amino acid transporter
MSFANLVLGRPIPTSDERAEQIGASAGIPIFGLDALSSAAYGPEAALTLLIPLGVAGVAYIVPISASIILLLTIVYFSYRQTIAAYPGGGGSYTVATENLGTFPGLLAAAALMIDYILVVAVGISAGVGALVSAAPRLLPHTLSLCLGILVLITIINLRGVREVGTLFMIPTSFFVGTLLVTIFVGAAKMVLAGGHPTPVQAPPPVAAATTAAAASLWVLLQAFSNGCTAMTGVEAVSNGVKAFREPTVRNAQRTLTVIIGILIVLLAGIAVLVRAYGIAATNPGEAGYQSVLSMLVAAVAGRGAFYYVTIGSVLIILALSANTAFADFPRLCRAIALNSYLPHAFRYRGRRLVYSEGIYVLAGVSGLLLILFRGVTDRLIPLFAIGAFLAFTLSQAGMVGHWKRAGGRGAWRSIFVNGLGAAATGLTLLVVLVAKFTAGAWVTALLIPVLVTAMVSVRRHYDRIDKETEISTPLEITSPGRPLVVVPIESWDRVSEKALQIAFTLSPDIEAVHVATEEDKSAIEERWSKLVEVPANQAGIKPPKLVILPSPYRYVLLPIVAHVLEVERANPDRLIAVLVPELVERHWYHYLLRTNRAELLKALLLVRGSQRIIPITVPWYLTS